MYSSTTAKKQEGVQEAEVEEVFPGGGHAKILVGIIVTVTLELGNIDPPPPLWSV